MFNDAFEILSYYFYPFLLLIPLIGFSFFLNNKNMHEKLFTEKQQFTNNIHYKKTILIVDDSIVVQVKLEKLFSPIYSVVVATNGKEALDYLDSKLVHIIITDLEMPIMDGFELISTVNGSINTEHIPIIAITSHENLSAKVHQIGGIFGIFNKPWNDRELLKRVGDLVKIYD